MPGLPAAHRRDDAIGAGEPKGATVRSTVASGAASTPLKSSSRPGSAGRQQLRHQLEHLGVVLAHLPQVAQQLGGEFGCVGVAHEGGEPGQLRRPLRQFVHLAVGGHLQPVLDAAQKAIGRSQLARGIARHVPGARQQSTARPAWSERGVPDRGLPRPAAASAPGTRSRGCRLRPASRCGRRCAPTGPPHRPARRPCAGRCGASSHGCRRPRRNPARAARRKGGSPRGMPHPAPGRRPPGAP